MEQQQAQDQRPSAASGDDNPASELAFLRRRLAFYEGFDDLIQQNISRSGDLLRRASEQQAEADRAIAASRADLVRVAAEQHEALGALADELTRLRSGLDALAGRIESARSTLDRFSPPVAAPAPPPLSLPASSAPEPNLAAVPAVPVEFTGDGGGEMPNGSPIQSEPPVVGSAAEPRGAREESGSVIVHGINGVDAARAYQSWLAGRPGVRSVTPREFGGGVLRLDVAGAAFPGVDAAGWPGGPLDVVETGPGTTVLRVRGAVGL
jgi:hypothetical protein